MLLLVCMAENWYFRTMPGEVFHIEFCEDVYNGVDVDDSSQTHRRADMAPIQGVHFLHYKNT
jgi:hypothetical protein